MEKNTYRRYLSINTEILGQVITNATGGSLAEYVEKKLWKRICAAHDAYWTLSNGKELASGGSRRESRAITHRIMQTFEEKGVSRQMSLWES